MMDVNSNSFSQEVLESDQPVVVDFWAPWCGPCQMMGPIIEGLAKDLPEVKFVKVNVDENQDLAAQFQIMGIPALFLFKGGQVARQWSGLQPAVSLKEDIKTTLGIEK
jgi:thioredoxin 1